jgi:hypothetical protein
MLNLANQFERRTGSVFPFRSRTVAAGDPELSKAPFLFLSGHTPIRFNEKELDSLGNYLRGGGYLWVNDSTDLGDDNFDAALRKQLGRLFPGSQLQRIPQDHEIFRGPYDLTGGFHGFQVPPGDKYRCGYLEGLWIDGRLAVVYTRNDYGDGLEIDVRAEPLMRSLTDLSSLEMQEASVQMGINLASYFLGGGSVPRGRLAAKLPLDRHRPGDDFIAKARPLDLFDSPQPWRPPEGDSPDYLAIASLSSTGASPPGLALAFAGGGKEFLPRRSKAIVERECAAAGIDGRSIVLLDVESALSAGARIALAFSGPDPDSYYETAAVFVRPGMNRNLMFDLRQPIMKTERTEWEVGAKLPADFPTQRLHLLLYPQGPEGRVEGSNLRLCKP